MKIHNKRQSNNFTGAICILIKLSTDIPFTLGKGIGYTGVHITIPVSQVNIQMTARPTEYTRNFIIKYFYHI
jgi:hypothetical protein